MANNPKITVITPVFNAEKDIEKCILSVANQTYGNKEHWIIDGLSTDGTLEIVRNYERQYPHIRVLSEKDQGIYDAMNKGIDLAEGDWLYFLGCDDRFCGETLLAGIFTNSTPEQYDILYGNVLWGDSGTNYAGRFSCLKLMEKNICHQAIFFRKNVFSLLGKYDIRYRTLADYLFNIKWFNDDSIRRMYLDVSIAHYSTVGRSTAIDDEKFWTDFKSIIDNYFPPEYIAIHDKLRTLEAELDKVNIELEIKEHLNKLQEADLADKEFIVRHQNEKITELHNQLEGVYQSISWKITRPLRKFIRVLTAEKVTAKRKYNE